MLKRNAQILRWSAANEFVGIRGAQYRGLVSGLGKGILQRFLEAGLVAG